MVPFTSRPRHVSNVSAMVTPPIVNHRAAAGSVSTSPLFSIYLIYDK